MEETKKHLSLPSNYVTLADLQQRWLQQQKQQQQPQPPAVEPQQPHRHKHQEKKELQQRGARFSSGKRNGYNRNRNHQKNSGDSQSIAQSQLVDAGIGDIDRDVNLEGNDKELKEKVKLKSKQVRVAESGKKLEADNEEKEKEKLQEDLHQQHHRGTAIRVFAGRQRQSRFNHRNHRKIHSDSVTAEKQRNNADAGIGGGGDANLESKGNCELKEKEKEKAKPEVYERGIKTEKKEDEDVKQEQRSGAASRSFSGKHRRNARLDRRKVPADFRINAEKQCGDGGIGGGESMVNATAKPKPLVEERKTEVEEVNGKKQREEVNDAENEKAKIIESQSSEEKSCGGGSKMEEVEQRFRGLGFGRARDGFNYTQHRRGSYGGRGYGYSNRNGYRSGYGYDYGYGNSGFGGFQRQHYNASGKRGEKMVWVKKVDNIDGTEIEN